MKEAGYFEPEDIFTLNYFDEDPSRFYAIAGELLPPQKKFSPTHKFIRLLQEKGILLRNYTQNIDNVEEAAGLHPERVIQAHGSWKTASCRKCKTKVPGEVLFPYLQNKTIARCKVCKPPTLKRKPSGNPTKARKNFDNDDDDDDDSQYDIWEPGVMKPDITFFGEDLPEIFYDSFNERDREAVDLVIVIGTSMQVQPIANFPDAINHNVPQIYISREPVSHIQFDVTLLGDCDDVVTELCRRAAWDLDHEMCTDAQIVVSEVADLPGTWTIRPNVPPSNIAPPATVSAEHSPQVATEHNVRSNSSNTASIVTGKAPDIIAISNTNSLTLSGTGPAKEPGVMSVSSNTAASVVTSSLGTGSVAPGAASSLT